MFILNSNNKTYKIVERNRNTKGNYYTQSIRSFNNNTFTNSIARDLIKIGQGILLGDRAYRRGIKPGTQTRDIKIQLKLENIELWSPTKELLEEMANFSSRDRWLLEFVPKKHELQTSFFSNENNNYDCISLFSDGLDSLGGAVRLYKDGKNPIFVLHEQPRWNFNMAKERLNKITSSLKISYNPAVVSFQFQISDRDENGKRNMFPENSRRTRPFFYLCLALATAVEYNIHKIYLNENGPLAVNLPINKGKVGGPYISRHAHPNLLELFEETIKYIWTKASINNFVPFVRNRLFEYNKSEIVNFLKKFNVNDNLILDTVSCENAARPLATIKRKFKNNNSKRNLKSIKECGLCAPCLIKRFALESNKIYAINDHFAFDYLSLRLEENKSQLTKIIEEYPFVDSRMNLAHELNLFCIKISSLSPYDFINEYFYEISSILSRDKSKNDQYIKHVYNILRLFSTQYISYLENHK